MARPREFDTDAVVDRVMEVFWRQGYEATSLDDLVERAGIGRQSLYNAFGSKHDLFVTALDRYCRSGPRLLIDLLDGEGPLTDRLRAALEAVATPDPDGKGCMLVNAAMETLPGDSDVARLTTQTFGVVEEAFAHALRRGQIDGELRPDADVRAIARFLLTTVQGLRVMAKAAPDRRRLDDTIDLALSLVA